MSSFNVCTKRIIEYSPKTFSEAVEKWFYEWLNKIAYENDIGVYTEVSDRIEIYDVDFFAEIAGKANPPAEIAQEAKEFLDLCIKSGRKIGTIYIEIF